jgi:hypothetical protein
MVDCSTKQCNFHRGYAFSARVKLAIITKEQQ